MWRLGRRATKVLQRPGTFALAVLKGFRANQGVLLAGAVAYYTLLSLVPLLILSLMALSHLFSEDQLLLTLREYPSLSCRVSQLHWSRSCGPFWPTARWSAAFCS